MKPLQTFWDQANTLSLFILLSIFTFKTKLDKKRDEFCDQNVKASSERCSALIKEIFSPLEEGVKQGLYSKSGGYRLYVEKKEELKIKYLETPRKGLQVSGMDSGKRQTCPLGTSTWASVLHSDAQSQDWQHARPHSTNAQGARPARIPTRSFERVNSIDNWVGHWIIRLTRRFSL